MTKGIGVDIVENRRFDSKSSDFLKRIFTEREISLAPSLNSNEYYASRFAAKEAFVKALGTGFVKISAQEVEILEDENSRPYIVITDKIENLIPDASVFLSISHERVYSVAMVVIDGTL